MATLCTTRSTHTIPTKDEHPIRQPLTVPIGSQRTASIHRVLHTLDAVSIPATHAAVITPAVKPDTLEFTITQRQYKRPNVGEVVVKMVVCGLCKSDCRFSMGPEPGFKSHDHIAGHEGIGHIVQSFDSTLLGCGVATRYTTSTCGACTYCVRGVPESCPEAKAYTKDLPGCFQQYITAPIESLLFLPWFLQGITDSSLLAPYTASLCSGATALKALRSANLQPDDVVVISGICGGIGHIAGMLARTVFRAKVVGIDYASKAPFGVGREGDFCDIFVPAQRQDDVTTYFQAIRAACDQLRNNITSGIGADAVLLTASKSVAYRHIDQYVRNGGTMVIVGGPPGLCDVTFAVDRFLQRQLKLVSCMMGVDEESLEVMEHIRSGVIAPAVSLVSLDEVPLAMIELNEGGVIGKVVAKVQ